MDKKKKVLSYIGIGIGITLIVCCYFLFFNKNKGYADRTIIYKSLSGGFMDYYTAVYSNGEAETESWADYYDDVKTGKLNKKDLKNVKKLIEEFSTENVNENRQYDTLGESWVYTENGKAIRLDYESEIANEIRKLLNNIDWEL